MYSMPRSSSSLDHITPIAFAKLLSQRDTSDDDDDDCSQYYLSVVLTLEAQVL